MALARLWWGRTCCVTPPQSSYGSPIPNTQSVWREAQTSCGSCSLGSTWPARLLGRELGVGTLGSSRPVQRPRSAGVHLPPPGNFERLPYYFRLSARAGVLGATWPGPGSQPSSPPLRPRLPGRADLGGQPPWYPCGLGQHDLR